MRAPTTNPVTQGKHGSYNAVDYSASPDLNVYAPEDGTISAVVPNNGTCGNSLKMRGATGEHGFCHLESYSVSNGQAVKKGQKIGVMGYTGYTIPAGPAGRHLHWILYKNGAWVYPPSYINEVTQGGVMASDTTINQVFNMGLRRNPDPGALATYRGTTDAVLVNSVYTSGERSQVEKNLATVQGQANQVPALQADIAGKTQKITQQTDQIKTLDAQNSDKAKVIEAQNKRIAELEKAVPAPIDEGVVVKSWFGRIIDKLISWNK